MKLELHHSGARTSGGRVGDLGGSPARSPLSLVAVHNGVSLTALPPKLHRQATPHLWEGTDV